MINTNDLIIALPKGRILNEIIPILNQVGIIPHYSFFDKNCRKLKFSTNIKNIKLIRVRSFDVATFLTYGAAHLAIIGSDVFFGSLCVVLPGRIVGSKSIIEPQVQVINNVPPKTNLKIKQILIEKNLL